MAAVNIPEDILGVPLFVPSGNNFFEIAAASLPNGDDALRIRGDVNRRYKAYLEAPTLTPDFMKKRPDETVTPATMAEWAMTFWFNSPNIDLTAATGYRSDQIILGCMNPSAVGAASGQFQTTFSGGAGSAAMYHHLNWALAAYGGANANSLCFISTGRYDAGNSYYARHGQFAVTPNTWKMITINHAQYVHTGGGVWSAYIDDASSAAVTAASAQCAVLDQALTGTQYLCLGSMSEGTGMNGRQGDYQMAKLGFHDHQLSLPERTALFAAMTE